MGIGWQPSALTGAEVKVFIRYREYDLLEVQDVEYSVDRNARPGGSGLGHPRNRYHKLGVPEGTFSISKHYLNVGTQADLFAQLIAGTTSSVSETATAGVTEHATVRAIVGVLYVQLTTGVLLYEGVDYLVNYVEQQVEFFTPLSANATVVYLTDAINRASDVMNGVNKSLVFDIEWRERDSGRVVRRMRGCQGYTHTISSGSDEEPFTDDLEGQFLAIETPKVFVWPSVLFAATVSGGVYTTSNFAIGGPADTEWEAVNTGLPDDGGTYHIERFWVDPFDSTYQYCHIIDTINVINSLYRRNNATNAWVEILNITAAGSYAGLLREGTPIMRMGVDDTTPGRLFVAIRDGLELADRKQRLLVSTNRGGAGGAGDWTYIGPDSFGNGVFGSVYPFLVAGDTLTIRSRSSQGPAHQSTNGGLTWVQITPNNSGEIRGAYADHSVVYMTLTDTIFRDLATANPSGNVIVQVYPNAVELGGHTENTRGWGGMWISRTNPPFQWILRRRNATDAVQELWQTTDAWATTAVKLADLTVVASKSNVYRRALLRVYDDPANGFAFLGFRTPTSDPNQPHTVFAWDALAGGQPVGISGSDPVTGANSSIPVAAGGIIDDGLYFVP